VQAIKFLAINYLECHLGLILNLNDLHSLYSNISEWQLSFDQIKRRISVA